MLPATTAVPAGNGKLIVAEGTSAASPSAEPSTVVEKPLKKSRTLVAPTSVIRTGVSLTFTVKLTQCAIPTRWDPILSGTMGTSSGRVIRRTTPVQVHEPDHMSTINNLVNVQPSQLGRPLPGGGGTHQTPRRTKHQSRLQQRQSLLMHRGSC